MSDGGFKSPNHTQTPNDLFDEMLPDMHEAELKVTLYAIRKTFGFHRDSFRLSITGMQKATGLSRQGVLNGAEAAEKRGTLLRAQDSGVTEWVVNVVDQVVNSVDQSVNDIDQIGQQDRPPSSKERGKRKSLKKKASADKPRRPRDPNLDAPAVVAYRDVMHLTPNETQRAAIAEKVIDCELWRGILTEWRLRGYKPGNVAGQLDAYGKGGLNGHAPAADDKPAWMRGLERARAKAKAEQNGNG